jgi:[glutamine synthetase] adenylyltransferase / [glutamine synthetase]-adenylyl-L-tyrosine phosphorylase
MFLKNSNKNFPRPFNKKSGIEVANFYQELPSEFKKLITGIAGCSPYLKDLLIKYRNWLFERLSNDPSSIIDELNNDLILSTDLFKSLRIAKSKMALWTALCDLGGYWDLDEVTYNLTKFADLAIKHCMDYEFKRSLKFKKLKTQSDKLKDSGWVAIAMGKMGAFELNYSSDIDLIFLFDETVFSPEEFEDVRMVFIRMTRSINKILNDTSSSGYVFRTDFRLRPNPSVTPICLSMDSAMRYYESLGRAWERAAFIKARACAGDINAGEVFLKKLQPFVWRKHLDFAAIKEAHDIRLKIKENNLKNGDANFFGRNIKLSEGGIRDIEFFAQTRQIIAGGRDDTLRSSKTCAALADLTKSGWVTEEDRDVLTKAYKYYRIVEHRLQMINDIQTHDLPMSLAGLERVALFMGISNGLDLKREIELNLDRVSSITKRFFSPQAHDQRILDEYLDISDDWLNYPALRSDKAKEIFRKIRPVIIEKAVNAGNPEITLTRFSKFLEGLPSGVQLFSLFDNNPELINLLLDICTSGEKLSNYLAKNSKVFDSVLDGNFFKALQFDQKFNFMLHEKLKNAFDYEDKLNFARAIHNEFHFRIGVHYLRGLIDSEEASRCYSNLANSILSKIWLICCTEFSLKYGSLPGNGAVVLGMGSLGAQSMNANSDVDLILIYDALNVSSSTGSKPLDIPVYYSRLTQKFLTAITTKMPDGTLYKVDMRLRPSGNKGPVATSLSSFMRYQLEDAWMWERLAFTRARVVCGDSNLQSKLTSFRITVINQGINQGNIFSEIGSLRKKINKNFIDTDEFPWDIKKGLGGIFDLQLLGQGCALFFNINSYDTKVHLSSLHKLANWSKSDGEKILNLYVLMLKLSQIFALIGGCKDLNIPLAKFTHNLVLRETKIDSIEALKNDLEVSRKWVADIITKKLK